MNSKVFSNKELQLEVRQEADCVRILWTGKSTARDPVAFIGPVLSEALARAGGANKQLVLDFRALEYMNSSTITPIIRILHEAKRTRGSVVVLYQRAAKWQEISFSALAIFKTDDERIDIRGV